MRWLAAVLLVVALFAFDRAYLDGQNTEILFALLRRAAAAINAWAAELTRVVRR
jgi:hypothetical protein